MSELALSLDWAWVLIVRATCVSAVVFLAAWLLCALCQRFPRRIHTWFWRIAYIKVIAATFWIVPVEIPILYAKDPGSPKDLLAGPVVLFSHDHVVEQDSASVASDLYQESKAEVAAPTSLIRWNRILVVVWIGGFFVVAGRSTRDWTLCRRIRAEGIVCNTGPIYQALRRSARRMQVATLPTLVISKLIDTPALMGMFRPAVIVPERLTRSISASESELLFLHELAHMQRRDLIWNIMPIFVHAALYFSPFTWLAGRNWYVTQEAATDELALQSPGTSQRIYAEMLLKIAAFQSGKRRSLAQSAVGAVGSFRTLRGRFAAMQRVSCWPAWKTSLAWAVTSLLSIVLIIPWKAVPNTAVLEYSNGDFESADLSNWNIILGPNATVIDQRLIPFDIDASGPKASTQVLALSIGQSHADPDNYCRVDVVQSLSMEAGVTYKVSFDWAARNDFSIDNFDGGLFQLIVDGEAIRSCDTESIFSASTETGTLQAEFTASRNGEHEVGARISRKYCIPFPQREKPALQQLLDNFSIEKVGNAEQEELNFSEESQNQGSILHVNNQRVSDLFKSMRNGTWRGASFPELKVDDIPALLNLAAEKRELKTFPRNPLSSQYEATCREGILALWFIEGIRQGGKFPSLNALCLPDQITSDDWTEESNRMHEDLLEAYRTWWKNNQRLSAGEMKEADPLENTFMHWH